MIGFFDSGLGGLTILREVIKALPKYTYCYLGDNKHAPYGHRSRQEIFEFTLLGVRKLFEKGAELVILGCNTSSSSALRRIQQEILPTEFPEKKVLGIIIPTAKEAPKISKTKKIGILATQATVRSKAYKKEIFKINPQIQIFQQACPLLVPLIENGEIENSKFEIVLKKYLEYLFRQNKNIDTLILGCTHYALIENKIKKFLPKKVSLISQGKIIAKELKDYLKRHSEIEKKIDKSSQREFFTTGRAEEVAKLIKVFYGEKIKKIKSV